MVAATQPAPTSPQAQPNGHRRPPLAGLGNPGPRKPGKIRQVLELQEELRQVILNPQTEAMAKASCARAFDLLEDRLRILSGKLKPGDFRAADLDPVNFARLLKRHPRQKLINLPAAPAVFTEAEVVEQPSAPAAANLEDRTHGSNAESPKAQ